MEVRTRLDTTEDSDEDMDLRIDESAQADVGTRLAESGDLLEVLTGPDLF